MAATGCLWIGQHGLFALLTVSAAGLLAGCGPELFRIDIRIQQALGRANLDSLQSL